MSANSFPPTSQTILRRLCVALVLLWRYSPTWALASSVIRLQPSLSSAALLQFLHCNILIATLSTASIHLPVGLSTGLYPSMYPFSAFLGFLSSFILNTWSTHWILHNLIFLVSSISLYKLWILLFYLFRHWLRLCSRLHSATRCARMSSWRVQ